MDDDPDRDRRRALIRAATTPIDISASKPHVPGRGELFECPACQSFAFRLSYGKVKSFPGEHTSVVVARIRRQYRNAVVKTMTPHFAQDHPTIEDPDAYIRTAYHWDVK